MAEQMTNDDINKILEMLKEHAENTPASDDELTEDATQITKKTVSSDEDIKNLLKKHFSTEDLPKNTESQEDYSFDSEDFVDESDFLEEAEEMDEEFNKYEVIEEEIKEIAEDEVVQEELEDIVEDDIIKDEFEDIIEEIIEESEEILEDIIENEIIKEETEDEALEEEIEDAVEEQKNDLSDFDDLLKENSFVSPTQEEQNFDPSSDAEELMSIESENSEKSEAAPFERSETSEYFEDDEGEDLNAVDIALMMALGGEDELSQTMGFEKIRQVVNEYDEHDDSGLSEREIYGYVGKEYTSYEQNTDIVKRYDKEKINITLRLLGSAFVALILLIYEISGWLGAEFSGIFSVSQYPAVHILASLQLLFLCAAFSYKKIIKIAKDMWNFSSATCFSAVGLVLINIINDICLIAFSPKNAVMTYHCVPAILFLISICYDMFELFEQDGVFEIVSKEGKKFVFEPYGKIKIGEDGSVSKEEIMDKDSYFASNTAFVERYFARTSEARPQSVKQVMALILGLAVAFVVMLILILCSKPFESVLSGFMLTASISLFLAAVLGGDYAFFVAYKRLKKTKSGIVGKAAAIEYGNCDLIYFDDVDVFDAKSVKTKGLKLYDNNEIYRVLYHTQAVFSKIGGPLRSVFEYATTEMAHSKNVVIKEISGEGVIAVVDGKTTALIGSGSFMKSQGLSPRYTSSDIKCEEAGEESIMFIALGGIICAKLYVTYKFSRSFEVMARKLMARGINIGIRSADPNINTKWANKLTRYKKSSISVVKPSLKELAVTKETADSGIVSSLSSKAALEALIMCLRLCDFESMISKLRIFSVVLGTVLSLVLLLFAGVNAVSLLVLALYSAACMSAMVLLSYLYTKR